MKEYVLTARVYPESGFPTGANYYLGGDIPLHLLWESIDKLKNFLYYDWESITHRGIVPLDSLPPEAQADIRARVENSKNSPEQAQYQILQFLKSLKQPPTVSAQTETAPAELEQPPQTSKNAETESKRQYTPIDAKLALEVYHALQDGKTQGEIAKKFNFDESQFRKNKFLKAAKELAKTECDEEKVAYRLMTVSGAMKKGKLEDGKDYIDYDKDDSFDSFD